MTDGDAQFCMALCPVTSERRTRAAAVKEYK
jgi:hypothetical protein